MPNKNYINGRSYEYKAMRELEAEGYTAVRTAGSHGCWDVLGIKSGEKVRCIQVKRTKAPNGVKQLLGKFIPTHSPTDNWVHELWIWHAAKWHKSS